MTKLKCVLAAVAAMVVSFAANAAEIALNGVSVAATTDCTATLTLDVASLGDAASAPVKVLFGGDVSAMDREQTFDAITTAGATSLTIKGLVPETAYVAKVVVGDGAASVTSAAVSLVTPASADGISQVGPGLYQTYFKSAAKKWDKDYTSYAEGTNWLDYANGVYRRELGAIMAYFNTGDGCPRYVSEIWGDQVYWPGSGGQWAYWGYMYFDTNKCYKLSCHMMDTFRIVVTHPTTGEQAFYFYGDNWKTAFTSDTFAPPVTGWYPIELRFSNGSGRAGGYSHNSTGAKYVENLSWSNDDGTTWDFLIDPGDGSLLVTSLSAIMVKENLESGKQTSLTLTFPPVSSARTIQVVYGSVHGGDTAAGWEHHDTTLEVAANATTLNYTLPSTWGTEDFVVRFGFVDGESVTWSPSTYWRDESVPTPVLSDVTLDGVGGDTLVVKGTVENFGDSGAFKVYTGATEETMTNVWEGDDLKDLVLTTADDGTTTFSFSLHEANKGAARYLAPGATVCVCVVATANGKAARSDDASVKMSGDAVFAAKGASASVNRRTLTFVANLSDLGMMTNASLSVWYGTAKDATTFVKLDDTATVKNLLSVTKASSDVKLALPMPALETTYYWQWRATTVSASGAVTNEACSAIVESKTADTTTYTWKGGSSGDKWSDPANWSANQTDCLGYPQSANATVAFTAGTTNTVVVDEAWPVKGITCSAKDLNVTFVRDPAKGTNETILAVSSALALSGANSTITLDGVFMTTTTLNIGATATLVLTNAATICANAGSSSDISKNNGKLFITSDSAFVVNRFQLLGGSRTVIRDATLLSRMWLTSVAADATIRFEGTHPRLEKTAGYFGPYANNVTMTMEFVVPPEGYDAVPVYSTGSSHAFGASDKSFSGSYVKVVVLLEESLTRTIKTDLISWTKGISRTYVPDDMCSLPKETASFVWSPDATNPTTLGCVIPSAGLLLIIR